MDRARLVFIRLSRRWPPAPVCSNVKPGLWQAVAHVRPEKLWCSLLLLLSAAAALTTSAAPQAGLRSCANPNKSQHITEQCNGQLVEEWKTCTVHLCSVRRGDNNYFLVLSFLLEVWYRSHGMLSESQRRVERRSCAGCGRAAHAPVCRDATNHSVSLLEVRGMSWSLYDSYIHSVNSFLLSNIQRIGICNF